MGTKQEIGSILDPLVQATCLFQNASALDHVNAPGLERIAVLNLYDCIFFVRRQAAFAGMLSGADSSISLE